MPFPQHFKPEIKTFLIVVLITIILTVGMILLLRGLSPAPTPSPQPEILDTSGWQTYRNDEYGFEVRYPDEWLLDESMSLARTHPEQERNFVQINISNGRSTREGEEGSPCQLNYVGITFQIGKLRQQDFESFEYFVDFLIENPERGRPPTVKPKLIQTTIGGSNALMIKGEEYQDCENGFYYVEQNIDRYTTISFITERNEDSLIIAQILSTFRFTP